MSYLFRVIAVIFFISISFHINAAHPNVHSNLRSKKIILNVHLEDIDGSDTLYFQYSPIIFNSLGITERLPYKGAYAISKDKINYTLTIEGINTPGYFSIGNNRLKDFSALLPILNLYLLEPGDSITITVKKDHTLKFTEFAYPMDYRMNLRYYTLSFEGKGAEKYRLRYQIDKYWKHSYGYIDTTGKIFDRSDIEMKEIEQKINEQKDSLSDIVSKILKQDVLSQYNYEKFREYNSAIVAREENKKSINYVAFFNKYLANIPEQIADSKTEMASKMYPFFLLEKTRAEFTLKYKYNTDQFYYYLKNKYSNNTLLRDKLLTIFLEGNDIWLNNRDSIFSDAENIVSSPIYRDVLLELNIHTAKGSLAYNFSLPDTTNNHHVKLSDFKGKVVFIDYWYTGCTACASYYKYSLSKTEAYFKSNKDVVFITISIDKDKSTWNKSLKTLLYTSPEVINLYTDGIGTNHPAINYYRINSFPSPMIIDKSGKIFKFGQDLRDEQKLNQTILEALSS